MAGLELASHREDEPLERTPAEGLDILTDGGQAGEVVPRFRQVVEADDADVVGNADAAPT